MVAVYVFDTSPLSVMLRNYYPGWLPSLWQQFDQLVVRGVVTSTREVRRELKERFEDNLWLKRRKEIFVTPDRDETNLRSQAFSAKYSPQGHRGG